MSPVEIEKTDESQTEDQEGKASLSSKLFSKISRLLTGEETIIGNPWLRLEQWHLNQKISILIFDLELGGSVALATTPADHPRLKEKGSKIELEATKKFKQSIAEYVGKHQENKLKTESMLENLIEYGIRKYSDLVRKNQSALASILRDELLHIVNVYFPSEKKDEWIKKIPSY